MDYNECKKQIKNMVQGDFENQLLESAFISLSQMENMLRYNNFACNIRELSRHILSRISPDYEIIKCFWYKNASGEEGKITRRERLQYAIAKGFDVSYIENTLGIDISNTIQDILGEIKELNKYTHVNPGSINLMEASISENVENISHALLNVFNNIQETETNIIKQLEGVIELSLVESILETYINEIDTKSTHHWGNYVTCENIEIEKIDSKSVYIQIDGNINVQHQIGSDGDMRRGDGIEWEKEYSFSGRIECPISTFPKDITIDKTSFNLNTNEVNTEE